MMMMMMTVVMIAYHFQMEKGATFKICRVI